MSGTVLCVLLVTIASAECVDISAHLYEEGHAIFKRFAESGNEFTSHEIADVLREKDSENFHPIHKRDLHSIHNEEEIIKRVRLDFSSGKRLYFHLQKRSVLAPNTKLTLHTEDGYVQSNVPLRDCYASGHVETEGRIDGLAAVSFCDGLHGTAASNGTEYSIIPVENDNGTHRVHVLSRPYTEVRLEESHELDVPEPHRDVLNRRVRQTETVTDDTYKTATSFVVEMAAVVDPKYYAAISEIAPGKEVDYILSAIAGLQAAYSNSDKVGYRVTIKIKVFEIWLTNPPDYKNDTAVHSLKSYCGLMKKKNPGLDMRMLLSGNTNGAIGMAWGHVCHGGRWGCFSTWEKEFSLVHVLAHEFGHTLSFDHHDDSACPPEIKAMGGGFMGGRNTHADKLNFSPCNKWKLNKFFEEGEGKCLFEETFETNATKKYLNLPRTLPGQYQSPDEICKMYFGSDYELYRPFDNRGDKVCIFWMCINRNKDSPEYQRVIKREVPVGYTCDDEMLCTTTKKCEQWDKTNAGWDVKYFRYNKWDVSWGEWDRQWSECSMTCGTGVQIKRRRCSMPHGFTFSPYCRGASVKSRVCNTQPCPNQEAYDNIRQALGDSICNRFVQHGVKPDLKPGSEYRNQSSRIQLHPKYATAFETQSCMLRCAQKPKSWSKIDAIYPDGTPCRDRTHIPISIRERYNIELRCVQGVCTDISDCPNSEKKDLCGVCGGDPTHCHVSQIKQSSHDVAPGSRSVYATLPVGTSQIDISQKYTINKDVELELWNTKGEMIIGRDGKFNSKKYEDKRRLDFAGTKWSFARGSFIRADGPISEELIVKALRKDKPILEGRVIYLLPKFYVP